MYWIGSFNFNRFIASKNKFKSESDTLFAALIIIWCGLIPIISSHNNLKKVLESQRNYYTSERGYFVSLWGTINRLNGRKKWKTIEEKNSFKDFDEFYNHWLEQKSIYGMKCQATGVEMTTKRFFNKPGERKDKCMTNISVERILSSRNYSPKNLMFTTWAYNCAKSNLSPKGAKAFLRIVKERYGTDEIE